MQLPKRMTSRGTNCSHSIDPSLTVMVPGKLGPNNLIIFINACPTGYFFCKVGLEINMALSVICNIPDFYVGFLWYYFVCIIFYSFPYL